MYEKLSGKLEHVVRCAHDIARDYGHEYVGTEHLLLGIFREGTGGAVALLAGRGADESRVKDAVERLIQDRLSDAGVVGRLPVTPHNQQVMTAAIEEARACNSKTVCTEHLLLALLREKGSVACVALEELGVKSADVRAAMTDDAA